MTEREMPGRQFLENVPANFARPRLAELQLAPRVLGIFLGEHDRPILPLAKRQLERVGQTAPLIYRRHQPVHHQIDHDFAGPDAGGQDAGVVQRLDLTVQPHALKAALPEAGQLVAQNAGFGA